MMKTPSHGETSAMPSMPRATAPASPTTATPTSRELGMRVPSGRPCSSSSACAASPIARKNASRVSPSHRICTSGASEAPITT